MTFVTADLGYRPREWQRKCHLARKRFNVAVLHRRAGKTVLASMNLINSALTCQKDLGQFAYISPFLKQSKTNLWSMLKQRLEPMRRTSHVDISEGELLVRFPHNGATIRLFGADNPDALRGIRLDGVVIDEVAQVEPAVWDEIVQPALSDRLGWADFIGTPKGINLFSQLYFGAEGRSDWSRMLFTVYETQAIHPDEIERLKSTMPENSWRREYLCDFAAAGDDQLVSLTDVEQASKRLYTERDVVGAPKIMGVDPARFGDDRSVWVKRKGLQMFDPLVWRGIDNMQLASRVAAEIEEWKPDGVFIDSGAGAGVIDRLRQMGIDVMEVPFGGKAIRAELFANRRMEMWWEMAQWVRNGGAIPNIMDLKSEIATPVYWYDATGRKVLESKDDIKRRLQGGASPDIADALALTFAGPVRARSVYEEYGVKKERDRKLDFNPYDML